MQFPFNMEKEIWIYKSMMITFIDHDDNNNNKKGIDGYEDTCISAQHPIV